MRMFLVDVRDRNFCQLLPDRLRPNGSDRSRVQVMAFPPLGIQTLAPVLRQRGHQVRMFDTCHPQMQAAHVAQAAADERPDAIGLSFLSATTYPAARDMARELKARMPETPVIMGGPFASMNADRILQDCAYVDSVGIGEGEELLPDYLNHLDDPGAVAGLVWRNGAEVVRNAPRPLLRDLDQYPISRSHQPADRLHRVPAAGRAGGAFARPVLHDADLPGMPVLMYLLRHPVPGRGKWRARSPQHVLGEMQQLHDLGYRSVYLTDDHFLVQRKRIVTICEGIIERKLAFRWGCEGRVDATGVDQLPIMKKANCGFLAFGVEAGTQRMLDRLNKRQTLAQVEHAVREAKRHGIDRVHGFFVIGSPGETEADILESFRFAARLELDTFGFNRLCAYRGTPLWRGIRGARHHRRRARLAQVVQVLRHRPDHPAE